MCEPALYAAAKQIAESRKPTCAFGIARNLPLIQSRPTTRKGRVRGFYRTHPLTVRRGARGMSALAVAKAVGVSASTVLDWECQRVAPRTVYVPMLAAALDVPVETVVGWFTEPAAIRQR